MTRAERIYRVLLRAYPASTREASGEDMVQLFADRLRDAANRREAARVWLEAMVDLAVTAPRERLAGRGAVAKVAHGPIFYPPTRPDILASVTPLIVVAILPVIRPAYWAPLFDARAALVGLPLGIAMLGLLAIVASVGIFLAGRTDVGDPRVQFEAIIWGLLPTPLLLVQSGIVRTAFYLFAMTLFVLVARFRLLMLALVIPFVAWLLAGPAIVGTVLSSLPVAE